MAVNRVYQEEGSEDELTHESELGVQIIVAIVELDVVHTIHTGEEREWKLLNC